jgi:hypothetical protein
MGNVVTERPIKGPITWSIFNPGVELSPVDRLKFFMITWKISTPGLKCYTFPPLEVTKSGKF